MSIRSLERDELKEFLIKNWMTHDGLWYMEVASLYGMGVASPMNLRVCRNLGRIEFKRFTRSMGVSLPKDMEEFILFYKAASEHLVPPFMDFSIEYPGDDTMVVRVDDCFAYNAMAKANVASEYECGIFERIEGWFDAMELKYTLTPDLSRCLKHKGEECVITVKFDF